jgi:spore coat protein CotH
MLGMSMLIVSCTNGISSPESSSDSIGVASFRMYLTDDRLEALYEQKLLNYFVPAEFMTDNVYETGKLCPQGAGSRYQPYWSYRVEIPASSTSSTTQSFNLSAQASDSTMLRSILATHLFQKYGFLVPQVKPVALYLNDELICVYIKNDRIDEYYFTNQSLPVYELTKICFGANFSFVNTTGVLDGFDKQIPDDGDKTFLTEFLHALDTISTDETLFTTLGTRYLDIPQYLLFHALTTVMNNTDGLNNNFYLYRATAQSPYKIIPHDFDNAFDTKTSLDLYTGNEIIVKLLKNDSCKAMYKQDVQTILASGFAESELFPLIEVYAPLIEEKNKTTASFNATTFTTAVADLKSFISSRRNVLMNSSLLQTTYGTN